MKVKVETEAAARLFNCKVGDHRDIQRPTALPLLESGDVSHAEPVAAAAKAAASKPKATAKPAVAKAPAKPKRAAR